MSGISFNNKRGQLIGFGLFAFFGLIVLVTGIGLLTQRISDKKRCTEQVPAVVVDLERRVSRGSKKSITYAPVFEYEYRGNTYQYVSPISSKRPDYERGERVTLMIDPNDPNAAYVDDNMAMMFIMICLGFGVIFTGFGGIGTVKTLSKKAKSKLQ